MNIASSSIDVSNAIAAMLGAILVMLTMLAGTIRWLWRQAQGQQRMTDATEANTKATKEANEATKDLSHSFKQYTEKADGALLDHEKRLTRVEDQMRAIEGVRR